MKPSRYNSFNQIHKGLRVLMYETATQLQQVDLSKSISINAIDQMKEVLLLFESHAHSEDQFFNKPLEKKDPAVSILFLKEHEEDHRLGEVLNDLLNQWKSANDDEARALIGRNLLYAFNEFIAFNLYHMNKEEIELNTALWKHYSDEEIKSTEQELVQQVSPAKIMRYAKWMIRGINDNELYHWLKEVRANAPEMVFNGLLEVAKEQLSTERMNVLNNKLKAEHDLIPG